MAHQQAESPRTSQRDRYRAGELLRTAALLAISLTIMLWTAVYFKRNSGEKRPSEPSQAQDAPTEKQQGEELKVAPKKSAQSSSDVAGSNHKKLKEQQQRKTDSTDDTIEFLMALVAVFSTIATGVITLFFCRDLERAFPHIADGLILSSLLSMVAFFLGSMLLRWHNFFEWVFWAYASAAVGYFVELRFRYCNHLIDYIVGL